MDLVQTELLVLRGRLQDSRTKGIPPRAHLNPRGEPLTLVLAGDAPFLVLFMLPEDGHLEPLSWKT